MMTTGAALAAAGGATPENYRRQTEMLERHRDDIIQMVQKSFDDTERRTRYTQFHCIKRSACY